MEKSKPATTKEIIASGRRIGKSLLLGMSYGAGPQSLKRTTCKNCKTYINNIPITVDIFCDKCWDKVGNTEVGSILYGK